MYTLFGFLLGICTALYCIRVFAWIFIAFNKKIQDEVFAGNKTSKLSFYLGGMEHLFYMIVLVGSTILLLTKN